MSEPQPQFDTTTLPPLSQAESAISYFKLVATALGSGRLGYPNFYFASRDANSGTVAGTVIIDPPGAIWRDVPLTELGSPDLSDFTRRMTRTQDYAKANHFVGGFPTFFHADYGRGIVCGSVLLSAEVAEFRDVSLSDLGDPGLDDIEQLFRGTSDYAVRNGFVGGFPNMYSGRVPFVPGQPGLHTVCGTILLRAPLAHVQDIRLASGLH